MTDHAKRLREMARQTGTLLAKLPLYGHTVSDLSSEQAALDAGARALELLRRLVEKAAASDNGTCLDCERQEYEGHAPSCELAALIGATSK